MHTSGIKSFKDFFLDNSDSRKVSCLLNISLELYLRAINFMAFFILHRGPLPRYGYIGSDTTDYLNILPEESKLAEVSSNIWGTKFKILGLNQDFVPPNLGQVSVLS